MEWRHGRTARAQRFAEEGRSSAPCPAAPACMQGGRRGATPGRGRSAALDGYISKAWRACPADGGCRIAAQRALTCREATGHRRSIGATARQYAPGRSVLAAAICPPFREKAARGVWAILPAARRLALRHALFPDRGVPKRACGNRPSAKHRGDCEAVRGRALGFRRSSPGNPPERANAGRAAPKAQRNGPATVPLLFTRPPVWPPEVFPAFAFQRSARE